MHKVRVAVLRGGRSHYETSLKTGDVVVKHLPDHYYTDDIFITRDGKWHKDGLEVNPHHALHNVDVVFNALHGPAAESGHVQHILELHKIPFTGTGTFTSAVSRSVPLFKQHLSQNGIKVIPFKLVEIPTDGPGEELTSLFKTFSPPLIVRPVGGEGVMIAQTYPDFVEMLEEAFKDADQIILEEYIPGVSASVGVIEKYRDEERYALPPISQAVLSHEAKRELEEIARQVHDTLGMRHYSRVDFLVSPTRGIFVTQTVPHPSIHDESAFQKALHTVGAPVSHFLDHIVQLALGRKV